MLGVSIRRSWVEFKLTPEYRLIEIEGAPTLGVADKEIVMNRRHLMGLGAAAALATAVPAMAEADAITKLGADQSIGLTVMHGSDSLAFAKPSASTTYAIARGWFTPPDPTHDYGLHLLNAAGEPYDQCAIVRVTPAGLAHGEEIVRQWEADETHPFHNAALRERGRRSR